MYYVKHFNENLHTYLQLFINIWAMFLCEFKEELNYTLEMNVG